jgi:hypothetical protein
MTNSLKPLHVHDHAVPGSPTTETNISGIVKDFTNGHGSNLVLGDVVRLKTSSASTIEKAASLSDTGILGVVSKTGPFANGSATPVLLAGYHGAIKVTGSVAEGDYLRASATAGTAQVATTPAIGTFARAVDAASGGFVKAVVFDRILNASGGGGGVLSKGWVDVTDPLYGAIPDNSTDNTTEINAAIAALQAQGGGTLYFPLTAAGSVYRHGSNLDRLQTPSSQVPVRVLFDPGVKLRPTADVTCFKTDQDDTGDFSDISTTVIYENVWVEPITAHQAVAFDILDSFGVQFIHCYVKNAKTGIYCQSVSSWSEGTHGDLVIDGCTMGIEFANNGGTGSHQSTRLDVFVRTASGGTGIKVGASTTVFGSTFNVQIWPTGNNSIAIDMQGDGNHSIWHGLVDLAGTTPTPVYALRIGAGATNLTHWQFDVKFQGTYNGGEQESGAVKNASAIAWTHRTLPYGTGTSNVATFLDLTDTPSVYTGASLKAVRVNAGETALEFVDFPPPALTHYQQFVFTGDNPFTFVTDGSGQPIFALLSLE